MRPKSQKRIKNSAEPFDGSGFYPIAEPALAEPFFKFRRAKTVPLRIQNPDGFELNSNVFVVNPNGSVFFRRKLFCSAELKKVLEEKVLVSGKNQNLQSVLPNLLSFFETLDAFGCLYFSAKPFWEVRSGTSFSE